MERRSIPGEDPATTPQTEADEARFERPQTSSGDRGGSTGSMADAFSEMGDNLAEGLRAELDRFREETAARAREAARGAGLLTGAGVAGAVAGVAAATAPLLLLRRVVPPWMIAGGIAAGCGALAFALAKRGLEDLGDAAPIDADELGDRLRGQVREAMRQG